MQQTRRPTGMSERLQVSSVLVTGFLTLSLTRSASCRCCVCRSLFSDAPCQLPTHPPLSLSSAWFSTKLTLGFFRIARAMAMRCR